MYVMNATIGCMETRFGFHRLGRAAAMCLLVSGAAWGGSVAFQVTGIQNGYTIACGGNGCGGKFDAEIGGTADAEGNLQGGTQTFVYCIDAQNTVMIPSSVYEANLTGLTAGSDLSNTRYGRALSQWDSTPSPAQPIDFRTTAFDFGASALTPTALERYRMEAWLVSQYAVLPGTDRVAIQDAMWQVTDVIPPAGSSGSYVTPPYPAGAQGAEIQTLLSGAAQFVAAGAPDAYWGQFTVVTNAGPLYVAGQNPAQELIAYAPAMEPMAVAAEPASFAGAIAALLGFLMWRKRGRKQDQSAALR